MAIAIAPSGPTLLCDKSRVVRLDQMVLSAIAIAPFGPIFLYDKSRVVRDSDYGFSK